MNNQERIIISVGGSLIVPDEIDAEFLSNFRTLILRATARGFSFFIIAGGGKTARNYQGAARNVRSGDLSRDDLDWLGIHATRLNAHLLRTIFREDAHPRISTDPSNADEVCVAQEHILIGAGWRPGWSTDHCAVIAAETLGARRVINLSDIDYVYSADPRTHEDATPIKQIGWADFRNLIPSEWDPGLSSPFDPIAAQKAQKLEVEVAILNGNKLATLENYINNKPFVGTIIS